MTFQYDIRAEVACHVACECEAVVVGGDASASESVELARVWCHNHVVRQLLHPRTVCAEHVQRVGVEHYGAVGLLQLRHECERCALLLAQSRTDAHGLIAVGVDSLRVVVLAVDEAYSLRHSHLHDVKVALRCECRHLSCTATHTRSRSEYCCARHAATAGYEQRVAHGAFVCEVIAFQHQAFDVRGLNGVV